MHSEYLGRFLDSTLLRKHIRIAMKHIKPVAHKFDAIAFRGMSGALISIPLAWKLKKNTILVRKHPLAEPRHSIYGVEGEQSTKRFLACDDFIASGQTIREVILRVNEIAPSAICVGVYLCQDWKPENNYEQYGAQDNIFKPRKRRRAA